MTTGPVSEALRTELLQEVQRQGIVVWLDKDASYTTFVNALAEQHKAGTFPYPVVGFRGSFLETLFALEKYGSSYDNHSLVVHMPGFNEDSIRTTPVLELYAAGTRFRKGLDTLIKGAATGRVLSADIDVFLRDKPTLEQADEWLTQAVSTRKVGIETLLDAGGQTLIVEALTRKGSPVVNQISSKLEIEAFKSYLQKLTGMDDDWIRFVTRDVEKVSRVEVLNAFGAWLLCVEYVHDLGREPHFDALKRLRSLTTPLVKVCAGMVSQLRKNYPDDYVEIAEDVEVMIGPELMNMSPEDLGQIDTFSEEENRVLHGAVERLKAQDWAKAAEWCKAREGDKSFWLQREPSRRRPWDLVAEAASFGRVLTEHERPFENLHGYDDALTKYAQSAALVDRAHRRYEQEWLRHLDTKMPQHGPLQEVLGSLRMLHRAWVDQLAKDFTKLCKAEGFLPPAELQQRNIYEQVVQPMAFGGEKVAVFLVDAFRYEMATELLEDLRATGSSTVVDLKARYAELPTITSVGMNALAPVVKDGRLAVTGAFQGFKTGESTVRSPGDRAKAMGNRTSGKPGLHLTLSDVCESTADALKRKIKDHQIVVVCSSDIDAAGEANVGLLTFEAQIRQIKAGWHHLQSAGIKHAVFTADHGFLLLDSTTQLLTFGKKTEHPNRYVLDEYERGEAGKVPIALAKLGYDGITGYVIVPEDTAVFDKGNSTATSFVHGGNSPEERIIPVLTVTRKRAEAASMTEYAVEAEAMGDAFGFRRIRVRLVFPQESQTSLGFAAARDIDLDIRVPDRRDIRAVIKEVSGAATIKAGRLQTPVGDVWTEVFFALEGPVDERVRVEVHHADNIERVRPCIPEAQFAVSGVSGAKVSPSTPPPASSWADAIEDESLRNVFLHIHQHGSLTEVELINKLGNARAARRFAVTWEGYAAKLPFRIRSESNASGKVYVRE